ncbi:MAG TPA: BON domain-containing protein [Pirellulaceae bacterium]|nr:BON domain-containing protein [Pirellulaceae bacterium]
MTAASTTAASLDDHDLARRVVLFLEQQRLTAATRLSVAARRGVVTVRGTVSTFHQRQLIVSAARRVAGAGQIVDELEVDPPRVGGRQPRSTGHSLAALASTVALVAAVVLVGCSRSGPPRVTTHTTKGSVTYQGQPISGAFLALHPKANPRPDVPSSTATVRPDGSFAVTTYDAGDGVPEGDYVVTIQWRKATKSGGDFVTGPNLLPARYSRPETSDVVVHVAGGQNELPPITLKR